jgi:hypothetical protein
MFICDRINLSFMGLQNFYKTNIANGEFRKHKGAYLLAIGLGFLGAKYGGGCARDMARTAVKVYDRIDDRVEIEIKDLHTERVEQQR